MNLTQLDLINLLSFFFTVENLQANLTQNDKQDLENELSEKADSILKEIHSHLQLQDEKLNRILEKLNA